MDDDELKDEISWILLWTGIEVCPIDGINKDYADLAAEKVVQLVKGMYGNL